MEASHKKIMRPSVYSRTEYTDDQDSFAPTLNFQKSSFGNIPHFTHETASGSKGFKEFIETTLAAGDQTLKNKRSQNSSFNAT